jgi:hypothetical protein
MKLTTKLIRAKSDFDYGRNTSLAYMGVFFSFATLMEVTHTPRVWYFILIPIALVLTWAWGMFLRKINFRRRENDFYNEQNRILMELHKNLKNETTGNSKCKPADISELDDA